MNSFYTKDELKDLNFLHIGNNVLISRKASIYSVKNISIGNNVRIDDFCILSGRITIGNHIHIAAYSALYGANAGIEVQDYSNISSKNSIYAISDDYSGESMTNPMIPEKYKNVYENRVVIKKHVIIGSGCVVLPGVEIAEGSAFGAMSLINRSSHPWTINGGIPFKKIKERSRDLLKLEKQYVKEVEEIGKNTSN